MNALEVSEDAGNRREILLEYLNDYSILKRESPEATEELTFDAYVQFSFAYYKVKEQKDFFERLEDDLKRIMQKPSK